MKIIALKIYRYRKKKMEFILTLNIYIYIFFRTIMFLIMYIFFRWLFKWTKWWINHEYYTVFFFGPRYFCFALNIQFNAP